MRTFAAFTDGVTPIRAEQPDADRWQLAGLLVVVPGVSLARHPAGGRHLYVLTRLALFVLLVLSAIRGAAVRRRRRTTAPAAVTEAAVAAGPGLR